MNPSQACSDQHITVRQADLPLSCPMPQMANWNGHPRIYLPLEKSGDSVKCPYCGTQYTLNDA